MEVIKDVNITNDSDREQIGLLMCLILNVLCEVVARD